MTLVYQERQSDSCFIDSVEHVIAGEDGSTICSANGRWYMLVSRYEGETQAYVAGPLTKANPTTYQQGTEFVFIKFRMGTFLRQFPVRSILDREISLPSASNRQFWLHSDSWQFPDYDNVETFVNRLVRDDVLMQDTVIEDVLQDKMPCLTKRTIRHRFLNSTGLTQSTIQQIERARYAKSLLEQGQPILNVVFEAGYYDHPHLTRSLKQYIGYTPTQILDNV